MAVKIFFCYAHEDEDLLNKLKRHLWPLQRQGLIDVWHDRDISAGTEWEQEISQQLNAAHIILLLVSPDFMYSEYCYSVEMKRAIERHQRGKARVIPVILRHVYWQGEPLGKLQALPTDAKPVMSALWHNLDEALFDVTEGIRTVVVQLGTQPVSPPTVLPSQASKQESADVSHTALSPQPAKPLPSLKTEAVSSEVLPSQVSKGESESDSHTVLSPPPAKPLPSPKPKALSLLRTLTTGHKYSLSSVAFSPDGQTLASGSWDETIKLWNLTSGQELRTLTGHRAVVLSVAFSPNGQTLASGSVDKTIKLWNLARREVRTLTGHANIVSNVAFSPDGQTLASGSGDKTIKLWNLASGQELRTLTWHTARVQSMAFSPNGQTLASGSRDQTIKLWNLTTGKKVRTLTGHTYWVESVAFSPNGQTLASGGVDKTIKLWNLATGQELGTLTGHANIVSNVAFSPDGQTLASGGVDKTIKIWGMK